MISFENETRRKQRLQELVYRVTNRAGFDTNLDIARYHSSRRERDRVMIHNWKMHQRGILNLKSTKSS